MLLQPAGPGGSTCVLWDAMPIYTEAVKDPRIRGVGRTLADYSIDRASQGSRRI